MYCECKYNPVRDLVQVSQYGYIDIVKANATSTVDTPVQIVEEKYNDIDDPRSIGERPSDEFELAQANHVIVNYKAPETEPTS